MNFKQLRKEQNMTQSDVAIRADISLVAYQLIERGVTKNPRKDTLEKLKVALQVKRIDDAD